MNDITPSFMTSEDFNREVKKWYLSIRQKAVENIRANLSRKHSGNRLKAKSHFRKTNASLSGSVSASARMYRGETESIAFKFQKHGVYFHYGVGRGYVRQGNTLVRKHRISAKSRSMIRIFRKPVDWIDGTIQRDFSSLANTVQMYFGDDTMRAVLNASRKLQIEKK